jgi:hypothetical protein
MWKSRRVSYDHEVNGMTVSNHTAICIGATWTLVLWSLAAAAIVVACFVGRDGQGIDIDRSAT